MTFCRRGTRGGIWTAQSTPGLQCGPGCGGEFGDGRKKPGWVESLTTLKSVKDTSKMMNVNFWTVYIFLLQCVFFGRVDRNKHVVYYWLLFDNITKSHHFEQQFFETSLFVLGSTFCCAQRISLDPTKKGVWLCFSQGSFEISKPFLGDFTTEVQARTCRLKNPVNPSGDMSKKKNIVVQGLLGDEMLPSYIGIIIHHYKDPY